MREKEKWELRFRSEPIIVRQIVIDILHFLDKALPGQTPEDRSDLRLIFNELLFNAVIHGNARNASKYVKVSIVITKCRVRAVITDEGEGYDYRGTIERLKKDMDSCKESGRGLNLVMALADAVSFQANGSRVIFTKTVGHAPNRARLRA